MPSPFKLALIQLLVTANKPNNLSNARSHILNAGRSGASIVVLPECFNSPYGTEHFAENAEVIPGGQSCQVLSDAARDAKVYLVAGSIPERSPCTATNADRLFNTCTVWNPEGELIGTHRKVHLFDINVPGMISFKESSVLTPGSKITTIPTPYACLGIGVCYDIRFPELAMAMVRDPHSPATVLIYPGAFNTTTGPLHWELLARARALDNQVYVAVCSPARNTGGGYAAWGYSMVVDPWGQVVDQLGVSESNLIVDVDPGKVSESRRAIPVSLQRRFDLYKNVVNTRDSRL